MEERRHFWRLSLESFMAEIEQNNQIQYAKVLDISLKGILLELEDKFNNLEDLFTIKIYLKSSNINMVFSAKLVYQHEDKFGFEFETEDLESFTHLRRLLELNADNPQEITEELFFLVNRDI